MAKSILQQEARELRSKGLGIKTIANRLKVSSSSVSLWCRDIVLSPEQIIELERRSHDPQYGRRLEYTKRLRETKNKKFISFWKKAKERLVQQQRESYSLQASHFTGPRASKKTIS